MVYRIPCVERDGWLRELELRMDFLIRGGSAANERAIESLAEAIEILSDLECELSPAAYGQVIPPGTVGATVGGIAATAAVTAAGAPELAPVVGPLGAEAGRRVEMEVAPTAARSFEMSSPTRYERYGALAMYGALFLGREAATNLARIYQGNGIPSFVYYDPAACRPAVERRARAFGPEAPPAAGAEVVVTPEGEVRRFGPAPGPVATQACGMWRVEVGEPTEAERQLVREGRIAIVNPTEKVPPDPKRERLLLFPPTGTFGVIVGRPSLLDILVDSEFGAFIIPGAAEKAPCDCAQLPSGKLLCTREGAIGLLSQTQVRTACSEIRPRADGRLARAHVLKEAQEVCGTLVEQIADLGQRFGARFSCLSEYLRGRGVAV